MLLNHSRCFSQIRKLRNLVKRMTHAKPWVDPDDAAKKAVLAAEELARREAAAAAAAEALLNVRALGLCQPHLCLTRPT